jgi:pyrroline-5-carboxylate reductase
MKKKCLVLGCGKMATAITVAKNQSDNMIDFGCYTPGLTSAKILAEKINGSVVIELNSLHEFDLILIACKPQQFAELAIQIKHKIAPHSLILSIMAGVKAEQVRDALAFPKVARIMPNTPIAIARGVNLVHFSAQLTSTDRNLILDFFKDIASSFEVQNEDEFDLLTPMVGSGPALMYYFFNGYIKHLEQQGISAELARRIVSSVFTSSAQFAQQSSRSLADLISDVTSKGGITSAALNVFQQKDLAQIICESYQAAYQRNSELNLK